MADIARGRKQFLAVIAGNGAFLAVLALAARFGGGRSSGFGSLGPLLVFCILAGLAYRGVYWARGAIVVWLGLVALGDGFRGALVLRRAPIVGGLLIAVAVSLAYGAFFLYNSDHIEAFLLSRDEPPSGASRRPK